MMVEAGADEVAEADMLDGIMFCSRRNKKDSDLYEEIVEEVGKTKKEMECYKVPDDIEKDVREYAEQKNESRCTNCRKTGKTGQYGCGGS